MKKETLKYSLICGVCFVLFVLLALYSGANKSTDMIMPAICIVDGMNLWYVLLLGLLAETAAIKFFLKESILKSAAVAFVVNLVSALLGYITLFIIGLMVELLLLPFDAPTFHISHWIVSFLFIILFNACLEGLAAKIGFKLKFKKIYPWLCIANAASLAICFLFNLSWTADMYF